MKTSDLERAQESFSRLWSKHDFRVKTFQESLGLTGVHLGVLGNKVVPDYSSLLGDPRERAESIQANHMDMCRFTGADDPNYHKVAGELRLIYQPIKALNEAKIHQNGLIQRRPLTPQIGIPARDGSGGSGDILRDTVRTFRHNLKFPTMDRRYWNIPRPAEETCSWLFEHEKFQDWLNGRNPGSHEGLLLLTGKPGAGKSVVMKEAYRQICLSKANSADVIATCFFNAQGETQEHSHDGMLRSLLYKLLPLYEDDDDLIKSLRTDEYTPSLQVMEEFCESLFSKSQRRRTFILIDALDECELDGSKVAYFWRRITRKAFNSGAQLSVLMSTRHFPHTTLSNCPVIRVDYCNQRDIALYVEKRANLAAIPEKTLAPLKSLLIKRSQGVFLWVTLMLERMIERWHEGEALSTLLAPTAPLPQELDALFTAILAPIDAKLKELTVRIFQWACLAIVPPRLHEWHQIIAFIRRPTIKSLREWRTSDYFTESDDQLERLITKLSRGLLEVRMVPTILDNGQESMSTRAGAGSLDDSHGETRVVEFIHQSVRDFFLHGRGFSCLSPGLYPDPIAAGHLQIMETCLNYLDISELDDLVKARRRLLGSRNRVQSKSQAGTQQEHEEGPPVTQQEHEEGPPVTQLAELDDGYVKSYKDRLMRRRLESATHPLLYINKSQSITDPRIDINIFKPPSADYGIDIEQWVASCQLHIRQGTSRVSTCGSTKHTSIDAPTQVLQDSPALLSYAVCQLFPHAKRAQSVNADPRQIVRRLQEGSWERWLLLSEARYPFLELRNFVEIQGLDSWFPHTSVKDHGHNISDNEDSEESYPWRERWRLIGTWKVLKEGYRWRKYRSHRRREREEARALRNASIRSYSIFGRRTGSVASFESAGSC
ncbi:hypothetical protein G7054_g2557 [Neopestalotiopsis clavispora]|nr:hypothetical protein G7054_g2557 [Neopestalotiopsis clavispora]